MNFNYLKTKINRFLLSDNLIQFTDNIYYKNGICDKLFYDSSLVRSVIKIPSKINKLKFIGKNLINNNVKIKNAIELGANIGLNLDAIKRMLHDPVVGIDKEICALDTREVIPGFLDRVLTLSQEVELLTKRAFTLLAQDRKSTRLNSSHT